ncbi:Zn-dependent hydrolase of beta-lactamase [Tritrichomonas foetus]|uniref:Zn-dependent hydrolase of beta-lactamase n=1 Tax=Tritrichomonas foetus TaxID=1144522 RepID=A0A1J4JIN1_9EUKA|nr:Zn-dependent hydrolase of beta-lactamase [Tritrichomonas foetus]|eukprot:OHS97381.1 Zn-dependent hydrolase of beta-lactamase [Tritrichomonas foetus]
MNRPYQFHFISFFSKNITSENTKMQIENLPNYSKNHHTRKGFKNDEGDPTVPDMHERAMFFKFMFSKVDVTTPLPVRKIPKEELSDSPTMRVWWLSHATILYQINHKYILTDPVFDEGASPVSGFIKRITPLPLTLDDLPEISYILLSHDHYDHLSYHTLTELKRKNPNVKIFAPLGVHTYVNNWDRNFNVVPFDWRQKVTIDDITFVCFPARHGSQRTMTDRATKLWCSWLFQFDNKTIYFPGDTAIGPHFAEVRNYVGKPIDLVMMPIGPQNPKAMMRKVHVDPTDARDMALILEAQTVVPIHYGTFPLGMEVEVSDIELLRRTWTECPLRLRVLKVGGRVDFIDGKFDVENEEEMIGHPE